MSVPLTPQELLDGAKCVDCAIPAGMRQSALIYLLGQIAGITEPRAIIEATKCIDCHLPPGMRQAAMVALLNVIASGSSGSCSSQSGVNSPIGSVTPQFIGQFYNQNSGAAFYYSTGLTSADWTQIPTGPSYQDMQVAWTPTNLKLGEILGFLAYGGIAGIQTLVFQGVTSNGGFDLEGGSALTSLSFPNLVSIDPTGSENGYLYIRGLPVLQEILLPKLELANTSFVTFTIQGNAALATLDLSKLKGPGNYAVISNASLTTINFANASPVNGIIMNFSGNALSQSTVDAILARCVAVVSFTSGSLDLSGGTSSAPSIAGAADKATLIARGIAVATN